MTEPPDLSGVMVAMLTPLDPSGEPDPACIGKLARFVADAGVRGVCPVGSTGEGPSLERGQRLSVVDAVVRAVGSRVPVVPGVFSDTVAGALEDLARYADHGAAAALVAPPHYYPFTGEDLRRFYETVADRSRLPLLVYNIPALTKSSVGPGVLASLAAHETVIGVKDSSGDMTYLSSILWSLEEAGTRADMAVLTGSDTLLVPSVGLGCNGAIVASANLVPSLSVATFEAARGGEPAARDLQARLAAVVEACRTGGLPIGWKAAAAAAGLCRPDPVPPRAALGEEQSAELRRTLAGLDALAGAN